MKSRLPTMWMLLLLAPAAARAQLFSLTGTDGTNTVNVGSNHLIDLLDEGINSSGQFATLNPSASQSLSLNYGGVANAITIDKNASNTQATLHFGPTGVTRVFNGTDAADLQRQIEDYLKGQGGSDLKDFLKEINKLSVIAVSDGNPNATTARMAEFSYNRFGFFGDESKAYTVSKEGKVGDATTQFHLGFTGKTYDVGPYTGESATVSTALTFNFSKYVGASLGSFLTWHTVEDADVYHVGFNFGVPIRPVVPEGNTGVLWQVTPFLAAAGSGSVDIGAGGLITGFGGVNLVSWGITERFTLSMANQIAWYNGRKLTFDDYEIDPGVEQTILKNGLRASLKLGDGGWGVYGGATYTNFLEDASIKDWLTPEGGFTYTNEAGTGVLFGLTGDFGSDYSAYGGRFLLKLAF